MTDERCTPPSWETAVAWAAATLALWALGYGLISFIEWEWADAWHPLSRWWFVVSGIISLAGVVGPPTTAAETDSVGTEPKDERGGDFRPCENEPKTPSDPPPVRPYDTSGMKGWVADTVERYAREFEGSRFNYEVTERLVEIFERTVRETNVAALYADPLPVSREAVARIILAHVSGSDPDELIHHPWQKSWEAPTMPRWEQFAEAADAILALTGETSRDTD